MTDARVSQLAVEVIRPNVGIGIAGDAGTFTLTGQAAAGLYNYKLAAAVGALTLTGQSAGFTRTRNLYSAAGLFVLTGQDAALKLPGKINADLGVFTFTGQDAVGGRQIFLISAAGDFTLTGQNAGSVRNRKVRGAVGAFTFVGADALLTGAFDIVDPVSGMTVLSRVRLQASIYADADAAYNAWASTLGVSATGTDYTVSANALSPDFVTVPRPVLDGSTYSGINIPHSGAVAMYMAPPSTTAVTSTPYTDSASTSLGFLAMSASRPVFTIRGFSSYATTFQQQNTNLKLRSGVNPSSGAYETIVIMTSAAVSTGLYSIRCAYRMAAGLLEAVFTILPADFSPGGDFRIAFVVANETSGIALSGKYLLQTLTGGTYSITSDDSSALRPILSDTLAATDTSIPNIKFSRSLTETPKFSDPIRANYGLAVTGTLTAADALSLGFKPGAVINELLTLTDAHVSTWKFSTLLSERTAFVDALTAAFPATITDTVTLSELVTVFRGVIVAEQLRLLDAPTGAGTYAAQLVDLIRADDDLRRFLGGSLSETIANSDAVSYTPILGRVLTDAVGIADALTQKLIIRVTANDDFNLDDSTPTKWIFKPVLTDGVEIAIGYIEPNGAFTTWAVNTRTGAVTEYQNFVFNSFAQNGHKYLGAADSGLYELDGADDDGTDVIAHIKSGYAQFGGSKYSSFKAAYLGMRGDGNIVLKLDTGDGKSYTYQTVIQDMQSTKVRLGKGLRARYFSFELISTGPDFDLDTIEFIPLVAQRRV